MIAGNEAIFTRAQEHALEILDLEHLFGIDIEQRFQSYVMTQQAWLMPYLARIYYSHISLGVCFLVYIYTFLPPSTFRRIRRTIAADNAIAFVIVTVWRCSPPRLLPQEYGFVDILHSKAGGANAWNNNRFQLTIAAMPSLHFGTALFFAVCMCRFSPPVHACACTALARRHDHHHRRYRKPLSYRRIHRSFGASFGMEV
ncbi:hypothetical protein MRS44_000142 [Fusarium solani]|uniref:uncharacterized protein n=1 Tax=Fusarium solani TaxID=169388 RepID=UPI0032C406B1|nr:hypothetical protein MRS44_000142 [Fusarium solani]